MLQAIDDIFRTCHKPPLLRTRAARRPVVKGFVVAGVSSVIGLLTTLTIFV